MAEPIPLRRRDGSVRAFALVDDADVESVNRWRWSLHSGGYAHRNDRGHTMLLHRFLMGLELGDPLEVDHENRNRLDCRRGNLRVLPRGGNAQNASKRSGGRSRFRGVVWHAARGKWQVTVAGAFIGYFTDELVAAVAADAARRERMPYALPDPELARLSA